jgi:hypothetical protein
LTLPWLAPADVVGDGVWQQGRWQVSAEHAESLGFHLHIAGRHNVKTLAAGLCVAAGFNHY